VSRLRSNDACWCGSGQKLKRCHGDHQAHRRSPVRKGEVSAMRPVPATIEAPPYLATGGWPSGRGGVQVAEGEALDRLRGACRVAAEVLIEAGAAVAPGVTTDHLDAVAHEAYVSRGAYPSTLGYKGFTKSVCTSVNDVVCHGIPDDRPLEVGDIVNIDVTAYRDGMHGDTSATFVVGGADALDAPTAALVASCCEGTYLGIHAVAPGRPLRVIGQAIEPFAASRGFDIVRDYGGHGIGAVFHGDPHINHTDHRSDTLELTAGMVFTIEPMFTAGTGRHSPWDDGWTEATDDGLPGAQFEHTVLVTTDGVEVLTVDADGRTAVAWPNATAAPVPVAPRR
jgi:methionyl aminopeptidase